MAVGEINDRHGRRACCISQHLRQVHIENLGFYELLKRRCRFIVAIDGERPRDDIPRANELSKARLYRFRDRS